MIVIQIKMSRPLKSRDIFEFDQRFFLPRYPL